MTLTSKQKILLPLLTLALLFLAWQSYSLFSGNNAMPTKHVPQLNSPIPAIPAQLSKASTQPSNADIPEHKSIMQDVKKIALEPTQREYLRLMSEYQIAQIKRLIAKDYESIALSNRSAAQAMLETDKLSSAKGVGNLPKPAPEMLLEQGNLQKNYRLVYTGQQYGKWGATLRYKNKLIELSVGSTAPDGAKVIAIDNNAVILRNGDIRRTIAFYGNSEETILKSVPTATIAAQTDKVQSKIASITPILQQNLAQSVSSNQLLQNKQVVVSAQKLNLNDSLIKSIKPLAAAKPQIVSKTVTHPAVAKPLSASQLVTAESKKAMVPKIIQKEIPKANTQVATKPNAEQVIEITCDAQVIQQSLKPHVVTNKRSYSLQESALLRVNPDSYAIQLMGNMNLQPIRKFLTDHKLQKDALYYKTYRNGRPWYVLIYQQYSDAQNALQAVRKLPIEMHRWSPFVKSFQQIQTEINKVA